MTTLRVLIETHSNEERTDRFKIGDEAVIRPASAGADDANLTRIGQVKGIELLDDHRLALTINLEAAASVVSTPPA